MVNKEVLDKLVENNLDMKVNAVLKPLGYQLEYAHKLFRFVTSIYKRVHPEFIKNKFKVVMPIDGWDFSNETTLNFENLEILNSECAIVIMGEGTFFVKPYEVDLSDKKCICYLYNSSQNEEIVVEKVHIQLTDYSDTTLTSIFARPAYKQLNEAFDNYDRQYVRASSCGILSQAWADPDKQNFTNKPEHYMRDSLFQYLQNTLRNYSIKREQNVDATHPVDIKVTWPNISNVALIEIKWLGNSATVKYRDARANEGAKQLCEYLEASASEEPDKYFMGYLAVFDGRRGKTANKYQNRDIIYQQEYLSHPMMNFKRFYMAEGV